MPTVKGSGCNLQGQNNLEIGFKIATGHGWRLNTKSSLVKARGSQITLTSARLSINGNEQKNENGGFMQPFPLNKHNSRSSLARPVS